jgi:hypothetical protein
MGGTQVNPSMSASSQTEHQPTGRLSGRWIAFILGVVFGSLALWSLCAGFAYFSLHGVPAGLVPPALAPMGNPLGFPKARTDPNDWWTSRVLSQVYTAAVDHVNANPDVIELLGEPIEVDYQAEELYRREGTGPLGESREVIAFDISGPQGSATVTVVAATSQITAQQSFRILAIEVTRNDGQTIDVPPPEEVQFSIR